MAAPSIRAIGTHNAISTAVASPMTVVLPTHAADDILLLVCETPSAIAVATPSGWAIVADSPQDNATDGSRLSLFWKRAASASETNPQVAYDTGHVFGVAVSIQDCITTGDPWDVTSGGTVNAGAGVSLGGDTTTVVDALVLLIVSSGRNATSTTTFINWANAALAGLAEVYDQTDTTGDGGGAGIAAGTKATAGSYGTSTVDITGLGGGYITIALKPPVASVVVTPGTGSLILTGFAPSLSAGGSVEVIPGTASVVLSGNAPIVTASDHITVTPGTASTIGITGNAPTVTTTANVTARPGVASAVLTGPPPTVTASAHVVVAPTTAALTYTGQAPTVSVSLVVTPGTAQLTFTGYTPGVLTSIQLTPGPGLLILTGFAPTVTGSEGAAPPNPLSGMPLRMRSFASSTTCRRR